MNQIRKAFSVLPNCKVELPQHFLQQMTFCRGPPVQAPRHLQVRVLPEFRPMSSCCLSRAGERLNPPSSGSCPGTDQLLWGQHKASSRGGCLPPVSHWMLEIASHCGGETPALSSLFEKGPPHTPFHAPCSEDRVADRCTTPWMSGIPSSFSCSGSERVWVSLRKTRSSCPAQESETPK